METTNLILLSASILLNLFVVLVLFVLLAVGYSWYSRIRDAIQNLNTTVSDRFFSLGTKLDSDADEVETSFKQLSTALAPLKTLTRVSDAVLMISEFVTKRVDEVSKLLEKEESSKAEYLLDSNGTKAWFVSFYHVSASGNRTDENTVFVGALDNFEPVIFENAILNTREAKSVHIAFYTPFTRRQFEIYNEMKKAQTLNGQRFN